MGMSWAGLKGVLVANTTGRALIVKELLQAGAGALIHAKNLNLMNALQLAVVDEAAGNGDVVGSQPLSAVGPAKATALELTRTVRW